MSYEVDSLRVEFERALRHLELDFQRKMDLLEGDLWMLQKRMKALEILKEIEN